jgi:hypothetical protein
VLENTRAQTALRTTDPALRELFSELMELEEVNRYLGELIAALDVRYDLGAGPVGGFVPDLELSAGTARSLLRTGRPVLLDLADDAELRAAADGWRDRVEIVTDTTERPCPARALLIRPDGYIAWASPGQAEPLGTALARWFGV